MASGPSADLRAIADIYARRKTPREQKEVLVQHILSCVKRFTNSWDIRHLNKVLMTIPEGQRRNDIRRVLHTHLPVALKSDGTLRFDSERKHNHINYGTLRDGLIAPPRSSRTVSAESSFDFVAELKQLFDRALMELKKAPSNTERGVTAKQISSLATYISYYDKTFSSDSANKLILCAEQQHTRHRHAERDTRLVELGDHVTLEFLDTREIRTVVLVNDEEQLEHGHVSRHAAVGKALLGSRLDEEVEIAINGGRYARISKIEKCIGPSLPEPST